MKLLEISCILWIHLQAVGVLAASVNSKDCEKLKDNNLDLDFQAWVYEMCLDNLKPRKHNFNLRTVGNDNLELQSETEINYAPLPETCAQASNKTSGIYTIEIPYSTIGPFEVVCDAEVAGGNWLVIQRNLDKNMNFYRPWSEYKRGFGSLNGDFFIGLDKLHLLTAYKPHELLLVMRSYDGAMLYKRYSEFVVGNEEQSYKLIKLGTFSGNNTDSFRKSESQMFSTYDRDNDKSIYNCASAYRGGWWYFTCPNGGLHLNSDSRPGRFTTDQSRPLQSSQLLIRPEKFYDI